MTNQAHQQRTVTKPKVGDRIKHFGGKFGTLTKINKGIAKYSITWDGGKTEVCSQKEFDKWYELCPSTNSTSVVGSVPASHLQQRKQEASTSSDCVSVTSGVSRFSSSDTQELKSSQTLQGLQLVIPSAEFTSLQPVPLANPSRSKGSAKEPTTNAIVSPTCVKRSLICNPPTSASKTCQVYSLAPTNHSPPGIPILSLSSETSMPAGTMSNGLLYQADSLVEPLKDPDCYWLESPGGLSSDASRSPGQSRLEAQLKKIGRLLPGECINPPFLEKSFEIPLEWSSPLESRTAVQLLAAEEKPSEIASTPELQPSLCEESSTSIPLRKRSQNLKPASGSLSACTSMKKGKPYTSYQYSYDVRDPDTKRGWRTAKVGVPRHKRQAIANLIQQGLSVAEILEALKK